MAAPDNLAVSDEAGRAAEWRARAVTRTHRGRTALTLAVAVLTFLAVAVSAQHIGSFAVSQGIAAAVVMVPAIVMALAAALVLVMAARAFLKSLAASRDADVYAARALGAEASMAAWQAISWCGALLIVVACAWFMVVNDAAVSRTFFDLALIRESAGKVLWAFGTNIAIFVVSAVLILVWSLVIAVARTLPGDAGRPLRVLAIAYGDLFRGLPAIITIYLIGFGLPLTNLPVLSHLSSTAYAIIALTLTYGAYTSEVYRAGIEGVHHSQVAAARSLGLSHFRTMRYVIVPLAVRNIIPPLMNNCISLQKDTALVAIIGTIDAFNQSKIIAANNFNLSAVTTVAILFIVITIPQARFVDRLIERDRRRMRAGG
ncbi:amino acid ABC transporter permease [Mesorhizobium sp. VK25A]|uniref:Amino acid ABC transporter permease n=1 Tax=Mesorhizobium vachelliae TaxID=3072309 RepID=A0ABU5A8N3_9HYPH|nr:MULTISPECIES: amino acid ABC transporter permease [unclassified Mesorhizobium]MDX8532854.1 amino acid ABC transporter permease [Mesorhizobium sp. VK25D]MDX8544640.1 amino acid ABC transporter permease [Mesorhizobium sp. VK25A]